MSAAATPSTPAPPASAGHATGTYLTFQVGNEEYGIEILKVREIIGMLPVTQVPGSPAVVIGVVNLRGKVIPVLSMRRRFDLPPAEPSPLNVIIIVESERQSVGLAVDLVREVATFGEAETEPPPSYGLDIHAGFVKALGKSQGRIRILLDIGRVLALGGAMPAPAPGGTPP